MNKNNIKLALMVFIFCLLLIGCAHTRNGGTSVDDIVGEWNGRIYERFCSLSNRRFVLISIYTTNVVDSLVENDVPTTTFSPTTCSPQVSRLWGRDCCVDFISTKLSTLSGCREGKNAVFT